MPFSESWFPVNGKGLFCFLIVLAFAGMQLGFLNKTTGARQQLERAKAIAVEAEQMHAIKTGIEINADRIVEQTMRAALLQNKEPDEIRGSVNEKLLQFSRAVEEGYRGTAEINFYATDGSLSLRFLNENSKVSVSKLNNQSIAAEYTFTGGLLKNKAVIAEIKGEKTMQLFKIPAGYTVRATVVG